MKFKKQLVKWIDLLESTNHPQMRLEVILHTYMHGMVHGWRLEKKIQKARKKGIGNETP